MIAASHSARPRTVRFAPFEMDLIACHLLKNGRKIRLQPQPFHVLEHLALRAKEPVLREELYSYLSGHNSYDSKHGLDSAIQKIRKALHDSVENPRFVETLRGRGYRFLKDVEFAPSVNHDSNHANSSPEDTFLTVVTQTRREFLVTDAHQELNLFFHRVICSLNQYPNHPKWSEGYILLNSIQSARSQQSMLKHGIGFELAELALSDPQALSIYQSSVGEISTWNTLGSIQRDIRGFWRPVIILVSHQVHQNKSWISSARKATPIERAVYEQAIKKANQ
ncbi:MAG TPA: winged helix-turn-helix domain-containing protein [Candidatus Angelobacter sp.]